MTEIFEYVFPGLMLMWVCFIANGVFVDIFDEYRANTFSRLLSSGGDRAQRQRERAQQQREAEELSAEPRHRRRE